MAAAGHGRHQGSGPPIAWADGRIEPRAAWAELRRASGWGTLDVARGAPPVGTRASCPCLAVGEIGVPQRVQECPDLNLGQAPGAGIPQCALHPGQTFFPPNHLRKGGSRDHLGQPSSPPASGGTHHRATLPKRSVSCGTRPFAALVSPAALDAGIGQGRVANPCERRCELTGAVIEQAAHRQREFVGEQVFRQRGLRVAGVDGQRAQ